jgi:Tfp pilus assembly protein PilV
VEVLVAISILMLSIVGPITIAAKSLQSAQYVRQQNTAFFLAQEGITAVNMLRNEAALNSITTPGINSWDWVSYSYLNPCLAATGCNIDFRDADLWDNITDCSDTADACALLYDSSQTRAPYQEESGDATPYTRVIKMTYITEDEVQVESTVTWNSALLGGSQEVTLTTDLFNLYK